VTAGAADHFDRSRSGAPESPWQRVNRVMAVAEKLDWLVKMKMEAPGCTREEAEAWAEARLAEAGIDIHF